MNQINDNKTAEQDKRLKEKISKIKHTLIVMSGKGGVGKTTVAVNLAYALAEKGFAVGILDVDVHGPNIAKMLGVEDKQLTGSQEAIKPVQVLPKLFAVSLALFGYSPDEPVIWRGPLKMATIKQLIGDVEWGTLDYLIVDSPPGTGDEPLSVCQLIPNASGIIIVTTPQDVAILDARKSVIFAKKINVPMAGIIENMSGFVCPHCQGEVNLFKKGGGQKAAADLKVPFLGSVPFEPRFVELADEGKPFVSFKEKSKSALAFMEIVGKIEEFSNSRT